MKKAVIQTRVDAELKKQSEKVLSSIGLDMTSAIRLFLTQVVNQRKIPFEPSAPEEVFNDETLEAAQEAKEIASGREKAERYSNVNEMMNSILEVAEDEPAYKK